MPEKRDNPGLMEGVLSQDRPPRHVFTKIRDVFTGLGILGQKLSVSHDGISYRVLCDEDHFVVYRVNEIKGPRHHVPGWPVVFVNAETVFDECCASGLAEDHCACGMDIEGWLQMIQDAHRVCSRE
jgi:hypothetical protein